MGGRSFHLVISEVLRNWRLPVFLVLIAILCASIIQFLTPQLHNVKIGIGKDVIEGLPFPFLIQVSDPVKEYRVMADVSRKPYQFTDLSLVPKFCLTSLELNGQPIRVAEADFSKRCDFVNGWELSLQNLAGSGQAMPVRLNATVSTGWNILGLSARASERNPMVLTLMLIAVLALASGLYLALRQWGLDWSIALILVSVLPVQLSYLSHTPIISRGYDVYGHLQHIRYIADYLSLPLAKDCWECYQPSLSYMIAAAFHSLAQSTEIFDPNVVLQYLSLVWFWVFLVMSARIVLLLISVRWQAQLAIALIAFWPSGFIHGPRISNEIPFYALFTTCLYFILTWWKTRQQSQLFIASVVAAVGLLVKATMLILFGAIGILILFRVFAERQRPKNWLPYAAPVLVMLMGIAASVVTTQAKGNVFLFTQELPLSMYVGNSWRQYLLADPISYFRHPYTNAIQQGIGHEYFWNYVLKTSMFGDFDHSSKSWHQPLALTMAPLLLGLIILFWIGVISKLRKSSLQVFPLLVVTTLCFLALFFYRFKYPYTCNNDFRYIFPVVTPIAILISEGVAKYKIGALLCLVFCALSAAFYVIV